MKLKISERMGKREKMTELFMARWGENVLAQSLNTEIVCVSSLCLVQLFCILLIQDMQL